MNKIFVVEGADGTGKSTLAAKLSERLKASLLHCSYYEDLNVQGFHNTVIDVADLLAVYQPVVIDRWAVSEEIYGRVFRGGSSYNTKELVDEWKGFITWIYCRNDNVVQNHLNNMKTRLEMFNDMIEVSKLYDEYVERSPINWHVFDFDKTTVNEFLNKLLREGS